MWIMFDLLYDYFINVAHVSTSIVDTLLGHVVINKVNTNTPIVLVFLYFAIHLVVSMDVRNHSYLGMKNHVVIMI